MEVVALKPAALTPWAALLVLVLTDTPEMEKIVRVRQLNHACNVRVYHVSCFIFLCVFSLRYQQKSSFAELLLQLELSNATADFVFLKLFSSFGF